MNKKINLVRILRHIPKGTKLWSPICGECELLNIDVADKAYPIVCIGIDDRFEWYFRADGSVINNTGAECVLFPSKENRDWSTFNVAKHKTFKPFQKVLVNVFDEDMDSVWTGNIYSHYDENTNRHYMIDGSWTTEDSLIIPYEGNENLLGTIVE